MSLIAPVIHCHLPIYLFTAPHPKELNCISSSFGFGFEYMNCCGHQENEEEVMVCQFLQRPFVSLPLSPRSHTLTSSVVQRGWETLEPIHIQCEAELP